MTSSGTTTELETYEFDFTTYSIGISAVFSGPGQSITISEVRSPLSRHGAIVWPMRWQSEDAYGFGVSAGSSFHSPTRLRTAQNLIRSCVWVNSSNPIKVEVGRYPRIIFLVSELLMIGEETRAKRV